MYSFELSTTIDSFNSLKFYEVFTVYISGNNKTGKYQVCTESKSFLFYFYF